MAEAPSVHKLLLGHQERDRMKLAEAGIELQDDRFAYHLRGKLGTSFYRDIARVRLYEGYVGLRATGMCRIDFASRDHICVIGMTSKSRNGRKRDEAAFRDFVAKFHDRLLSNGLAHAIDFRRGAEVGQFWTLVAFIAVFVLVMPFLIPYLWGTEKPARAVLLTLVGVVSLPLAALNAYKNKPGLYDPATPPDIA